MSDLIVSGLFSVAVATITGIVAIVAARSASGIEKLRADQVHLRRQSEQLLLQVEAYHLLEDLYAKDMADLLQDTAPRTLKTEFRNRVVELHQCARPFMTANEAKKRLQEVT